MLGEVCELVGKLGLRVISLEEGGIWEFVCQFPLVLEDGCSRVGWLIPWHISHLCRAEKTLRQGADS